MSNPPNELFGMPLNFNSSSKATPREPGATAAAAADPPIRAEEEQLTPPPRPKAAPVSPLSSLTLNPRQAQECSEFLSTLLGRPVSAEELGASQVQPTNLFRSPEQPKRIETTVEDDEDPMEREGRNPRNRSRSPNRRSNLGDGGAEKQTRHVSTRLTYHGHRLQVDSPFDERVLSFPIPPKVKAPSIRFDGTTDPDEHLAAYDAHMYTYDMADPVWCRLFPTTLSGLAQTWFKNLPKGSIRGYYDLSTTFKNQYAGNRRREKDTIELLTIRQGHSESIREYMARFDREAHQIRCVDPNMAKFALMHGLNDGDLKKAMVRDPPATLADARRMADGYIREEEYQRTFGESKHKSEGRDRDRRRDDRPRHEHAYKEAVPSPSKEGRRSDKTEGGRSQYLSKYSSYTPLTVSRAEVFALTKDDDKWKKPKQPNHPGNKSKYCEFHRWTGHNTDECHHLKDAIEDLIRQGYLTKFKARRPDPSTIVEEQPKSATTVFKRLGGAEAAELVDIHMIAGGDEFDGSLRTYKSSIRELKHMVNFSTNSPPPTIQLPDMKLTAADHGRVDYPHSDPLVISIEMSNHRVHRCMVDTGAYTNVLYKEAFNKLGLEERHLQHVKNPLYSFTGAGVVPLGTIQLPIKFGEGAKAKNMFAEFIVIDAPAAYNALLGRITLAEAYAVVSIRALALVYVSDKGTAETLHGSQIAGRTCNSVSVRNGKRMRASGEEADTQEQSLKAGKSAFIQPKTDRPKPGDETMEVELDPGRSVIIGKGLDENFHMNLVALLEKNKDVFAYSAAEMPGVSPDIICHKLNVLPEARPIKQKKRNVSAEKDAAIKEEVDKLLAAGFIEPCEYPEWLANVVMVKKASGAWRMCVDFTNLNKACPKDCYPLPRIDQLVDSTSGHSMLSFLDAFSGYHQVFLSEEDRAKCAFITSQGVFSYRMMPFGLKNAGATYQRLVDKVFEGQKGRNMEVYVDDAIVKSKSEEEHLRDLEETFESLRKYQMKLNPHKCTFGVRSGKFLGFLVSERGIEANPEKVDAVLTLGEPRNIREIQGLTGRMAALSRFVSRSADKTTPFFKVLKGNKEYKWGVEQKEAFEALKEHLKQLPTLARPMLRETLYLYIAVTTSTISAVIVREEAKQQQPIYFVSYTLGQAERNYSLIEKAAYAVVIASRKLRPYFDAHPVVVLTDQPLEKAMELEKSGRLLKWAIELSGYGIKYQPRTAIKAQALADFLAECSYRETVTPTPGVWEVYTDGSATNHGSGAGVVLISPDKTEYEHALRFSFPASNNEAEYEAIIAGMELARCEGAEHVVLMTDSQLVSNQIRGEYETREESMIKYMEAVKREASMLKSFDIKLIPRGKNSKADALSKLASSSLDNARRIVTVDLRQRKSIGEEGRSICVIEEEANWMTPMIEYINNATLPTDQVTAKKIRRTGHMFRVINNELFRTSFSAPLLKCISGEDSHLVLKEIHEGICGHHVGGRNLAHKVLRAGYYWPTMLSDAKELTRKCRDCQIHAPLIHAPAKELQPVLSPIPFAQWGMDIIGPFTIAAGGRKFLIVAVDYFSKWIEAEAVAKITEPAVRKVIWANIITRFGIPKVIVFDHGRQFWNNPIKAWLTKFGVNFAYSSVCHPQSNGQAESANKQVLLGLRKMVDDRKGKWVDELPKILWSLRTTEKEATGYTPFHLVYGSEALLPAEVSVPSARSQYFIGEENEEAIRTSLDLLDEVRDKARGNILTSQARMRKAYNAKVRARSLKIGELVLRKAAAVGKGNIHGKLSANWEGPYVVKKVISPGTYQLADTKGNELSAYWNADTIKKYYA